MAIRNKKKAQRNFRNYMLNRTLQMFKYEGLPLSIPYIELEKLLQEHGYAIICKVNGDLIACNGTLGGELDQYGRPTTAIVNIPYLNFGESLEIGKECTVIYNDFMKLGFLPLLDSTGEIMTEIDISILVATINRRQQNVISASDDTTIESAKAYLKKIEDGELSVIGESKLFESLRVQGGNTQGQNTLADLYQTQQYAYGTLLNNLGLNSNFNMKKERLITAEIEGANDVIFPLVDSFLTCRVIGLDETNALFETNISVEFGSVWAVNKELQESELQISDEEEETPDGGEETGTTEDTTETTNEEDTSSQETEPDSEPIDQEESEEDTTPLEDEENVSRETEDEVTDEDIIEAQNEEIEELQEQLEEKDDEEE